MTYRKRPKNGAKPSSVYLQREGSSSIYKIGVAADTKRRLKQNQTGNSSTLTNARTFAFPTKTKAHKFEKALHAIFEPQHVRGEFYKLSSANLQLIESMYKVTSGDKRNFAPKNKKTPLPSWAVGLIALVGVLLFSLVVYSINLLNL